MIQVVRVHGRHFIGRHFIGRQSSGLKTINILTAEWVFLWGVRCVCAHVCGGYAQEGSIFSGHYDMYLCASIFAMSNVLYTWEIALMLIKMTSMVVQTTSQIIHIWYLRVIKHLKAPLFMPPLPTETPFFSWLYSFQAQFTTSGPKHANVSRDFIQD